MSGTTFDSLTPRFDSTAITLDGGTAVVTTPSLGQNIRLDTTAVALDTATNTVDGGLRAALSPSQNTKVDTIVVRLDTVVNTIDGGSVGVTLRIDRTDVRLDTTSVTVDGAGAPGTGRTAIQSVTLPRPVQVATARGLARAGASQTLVRPAQTATLFRVGTPASAAADQMLPLPAQAATAVAVLQAPDPGPPLPDQPVEEPETPVVPGDLADMIAHQAAVMPPWWGAPGIVPAVLRIPLAMAGSVGVWIYDLIAYAKRQTRILTADGGWLDLIAYDFFGRRVARRQGQSDDSFRRRIMVEMFRPRGTRPAMQAVLKDLTGYEPRIFEPSRPADVGGVGIPSGLGVGVSGAVGSINLPGEYFIDVYRDPDFGIPFAAGVGTSVGGVGVPSRLVVGTLDEVVGALRDEDVYAAVEATRPVGTVAWVRISLGQRQ